MTTLLYSLDERFARIHQRSIQFISGVAQDLLYKRPRELPRTFTMFTCGEYVLRSAASVEQCFGGITTRLWDDPFEWTLPEKLFSGDLIIEYLNEVEATRVNGMDFFTSDADLYKNLPAPVALSSVFDLLLSTIGKAEHFQGRAFAVFQYFSDEKLPTP